MMSIEQERPTLIFDLGGVLIDWNPQYLYRKIFAGSEEEMEFFLSTVCPLEWNEQQDAGRPFAEAIAERSKLFPEYAPYISAYWDRWEETISGEISGTVEILAALREHNFPLYALSNWSAETFPLVKNRFEFLSWFTEVFISGDAGIAKPDPRFYQHMLERIDHSAGQCLFIDDNERNILAAEKLGFQVFHFTSPDGLREELVDRRLIAANTSIPSSK
ncbi:MAG: HAD family phosphatase [Candidatus Promineifilaceae bacterium]|nr:HAD family phosphatase [Candidatus Promineifilaceae bacterium]